MDNDEGAWHSDENARRMNTYTFIKQTGEGGLKAALFHSFIFGPTCGLSFSNPQYFIISFFMQACRQAHTSCRTWTVGRTTRVLEYACSNVSSLPFRDSISNIILSISKKPTWQFPFFSLSRLISYRFFIPLTFFPAAALSRS